jgi:hypothetical protein
MNALEEAAGTSVATIEHLEKGWAGYASNAGDVVVKLQLLTKSLSNLALVLPDPKAPGPITDLRYSRGRLVEEISKLKSSLAERGKDLKKHQDELERDWEERKKNLATKEAEWEASKDVRNLVVVQTGTKVKLDVGGRIFSVSVGTLLKCKDSFFSALFGHGWASPPGSDGTYFLDRDPTAYQTIFNYLRDGDSALENLGLKPGLRDTVRKEAEFLSMEDLAGKMGGESGKWEQKGSVVCPGTPMHYSQHFAHWDSDFGAYRCTSCKITFVFTASSTNRSVGERCDD